MKVNKKVLIATIALALLAGAYWIGSYVTAAQMGTQSPVTEADSLAKIAVALERMALSMEQMGGHATGMSGGMMGGMNMMGQNQSGSGMMGGMGMMGQNQSGPGMMPGMGMMGDSDMMGCSSMMESMMSMMQTMAGQMDGQAMGHHGETDSEGEEQP